MNKIIVSAKLYHETVYCSFKTFFSLFQQWRKYNLSRFLHKSFIILTYNCNQIWKYKTTNCLKLGSVLQNLDTLLLPSKVCKHSLRQRQQIQLNQFLFAKVKVLHYFYLQILWMSWHRGSLEQEILRKNGRSRI